MGIATTLHHKPATSGAPAETIVVTDCGDCSALQQEESAQIAAVAGDWLIAVVSSFDGSLDDPADDNGFWSAENFTRVSWQQGPTGLGVGIWALRVATGGTHAVGFEYPLRLPSAASAAILKVAGLSASAFDVQAAADGNSTSPDSGATAARAQARELVVYAHGRAGNPATPGTRNDGGTDFCPGYGTAAYLRAATQILTTGTGSVRCQVGGMTTGRWVAAVAAFKAAA